MNLVLVDQWAKEFLQPAKQKLWGNFADFFQVANQDLSEKARTEKASMVRLELLDDDGIPWIYDPKTQQIFWQQKISLNIGEETFWLQIKADHRTPLNQISYFQHEQWKDQSELKKHLSTMLEASLISHLTGTELRLK